jgi:hypothetical protein
MLKEERELRGHISKRWGATHEGSVPTVIGLAITAFGKAVRAEEREACAKAAEGIFTTKEHTPNGLRSDIAAAIRGRK